MMAGIEFNGISNLDVGAYLSGDVQIGYPQKIKVKERLTGTNIEYDFSEVNGIQQYGPRTIYAPINVLDFDRLDYRSAQLKATQIVNWLMKPNKRVPLKINKLPEYYFMAEVENTEEIMINALGKGHFTAEFTAYPYKIRTRYSNDDEWDTLNFNNDIVQVTKTIIPPILDQLPFNPLNVGDMVNIGGWAQFTANTGKINRYESSQTYVISDVRAVTPDFNLSKFSSHEYFLPELNAWLLAQDIVQARREPVNLQLFNNGVTVIKPEIIYEALGASYGGYTIERDGRYYNFKHGEVNRLFRLNPGRNNLYIYGQALALDFVWQDEVL